MTKNEQHDLPGCLKSVAWCDDVHVFDSGSTDATHAIAKDHGATLTVRTYPNNPAPFGGDESAHKNWALQNIAFKHAWVLMLDADERTTPALLEAMATCCRADSPAAAYRINRRDHFMGRWIKHVTPSPFNIRLVRPHRIRFERIINPITVVDGPTLELNAHFDHFPFSKGMSHWFAKHNGYSTHEAQHILATRQTQPRYEWRKALLSADRNERRVHQKGLYYQMPLRPLVMFFGLYVGKRGFLDGRAGLVYAMLRAIYEYMIVLKVEELEQTSR
ncbi:MAG: glycosyltransferase family 2 protein [Acidobacteriota bacterium]